MINTLKKDLVGSTVLERNVFVSNSEIKAEKEQSDHELKIMKMFHPDGLVDCEDPECCENPVCERSQLCHTVSAPIGEHLNKIF